MAINKERLSEIVREKKTFWWCQPYADSFIVREIRQPRVEVVVKDKYCVLIENDKECLVEFEHLTEDKEDAEELAEFSNITRTDTLKCLCGKKLQILFMVVHLVFKQLKSLIIVNLDTNFN